MDKELFLGAHKQMQVHILPLERTKVVKQLT